MSKPGPLRAAPPVRDLLNRAVWADLERIAARHGAPSSGRRRDLAVERLGALLQRPQQINAAATTLSPNARAVLSLLLLLGSSDDERGIVAARDRLVAARPDLGPTLGRVYIAHELQTLTALGLVFLDRRQYVVPREVLHTLAPVFPPAPQLDQPLDAAPLPYVALRYTLDLLISALETRSPVAVQGQRVLSDRAVAYKPLLLPSDVAAEIGREVGIAADQVGLLVSLLHAADAIAPVDSKWRVQPAWNDLREAPPRPLLDALLAAWQRPRAWSDVVRTGMWSWTVAPDAEPATIGAIESSIRSLVWRWLHWCGPATTAIADLSRTLGALHPTLLPTEAEVDLWITAAGSYESHDQDALLPALLREIIEQLGQLGLLMSDGERCRLTPLALWLDSAAAIERPSPTIWSDDHTIYLDPLHVAPDLLRLMVIAGQQHAPRDGWASYAITPAGLSRVLAIGVGIAEFEAALTNAGAQLDPTFRDRLAVWRERAGRLRLHQPLTVLLTAETAPLDQILHAAGVADAAEVIGPGCALLLPDAADAAIEALRARGFWPRTIG